MASVRLEGKCLSQEIQDLSPLSCGWFLGTGHYPKLEGNHGTSQSDRGTRASWETENAAMRFRRDPHSCVY